ncbi:uncharacterized protein LOC127670215 [Apodemus sylvaticus]|uniref:uncharacterized protein LOC127670215 n=1 Tax=Apodemus sylvaticus TaxID=10129 RepID=UPI00224216EA|nr:uncharacterized protein LOC127670215 [Apodemus sylvaticus]
MSTKEVSAIYILREETNAMGAAQIMLGLIHSALGILWLSLYRLEEKKHSIGFKLMLTSICYLFASGTLFISSGASSITQGSSSTCQRMLAIITNTLSIFVTLFGSMLFGYEFPIFESIGIDYIWSNMAGMMLLQISVICTISELVVAIVVLHWFITSNMIRMPSAEREPIFFQLFLGSSHTELPPPPSKPPSVLEVENVSEESLPKQIEDEEKLIEAEED